MYLIVWNVCALCVIVQFDDLIFIVYSVDFKTSGRCLLKGGKYVAGTKLVLLFIFTAMTKTTSSLMVGIYLLGVHQSVGNGVCICNNNHGMGFSKNQPIVCKITMRTFTSDLGL